MSFYHEKNQKSIKGIPSSVAVLVLLACRTPSCRTTLTLMADHWQLLAGARLSTEHQDLPYWRKPNCKLSALKSAHRRTRELTIPKSAQLRATVDLPVPETAVVGYIGCSAANMQLESWAMELTAHQTSPRSTRESRRMSVSEMSPWEIRRILKKTFNFRLDRGERKHLHVPKVKLSCHMIKNSWATDKLPPSDE